jgi:glutaredoxin
MIKIFTLEGCSSCKDYKLLLEKNGINYNEIVCTENKNGSICDNLESIVKCERYPMTMLNTGYILCIADDSSQLGKVHEIGNHKIIYVYSINNMLDITKKLLYLK